MPTLKMLNVALGATLLVSGLSWGEEKLPPSKSSQVDTQKSSPQRSLNIEADNEESPRELYIIPWQDSRPTETETEATRLLFDDLEPIDPEVFRRQIQYYTAPLDDQ